MGITASFSVLRDKLQSWLDTVIAMLPNLVVAVVVLVLFVLLSRLARKITTHLLGRFSSNPAVNRLIAAFISFSIMAVGVFVALGIMQLQKTVTSLLAGVGIVGLALSFAFQDMATNFVAGIFIAIRKPFHVGDIIESNDHFGTVSRISLRTTDLRTFQGQIILIPNKEVFQKPIINYSETGMRRVDLEVGVSYGDDLEKVKRVTLEAVKKIEGLDTARDTDLYFSEFGNSSINFVVRYWVKFSGQKEYLAAVSEGIMHIKAAYDANDITIPFPIRTLDFGIKGGEKLSEMLPAREKNGGRS